MFVVKGDEKMTDTNNDKETLMSDLENEIKILKDGGLL